MNDIVRSLAMTFGHWLRRCLFVAILALPSTNAWAGDCVGGHNVPMNCPPPPDPPPAACSYASAPNVSVPAGEVIGVIGAPGTVYWTLAPGSSCSGTESSITCLGMTITLPAGAPDPVASTATVTLGGKAQGSVGESQFTLTVTDASDTTKQCSRIFMPRVTSSGGGWGDPHITTVDGMKYDFQSAGEFIALRGAGLEIQTRQTGVATSSVPTFVNEYTGLSSCVALYTAVAARIGTHRVTYQPNISGKPDPSGMQLRVDGVLTTIGANGITLSNGETGGGNAAGALGQPSGDRIVKSPEGDGIEIQYANGTKVVITAAWWLDQQKWYLNVAVYDTSATEGIMGSIAKGSWLPALADGTNVGPKPGSIHDRFVQLYTTFANSWRVTTATSLFDYDGKTTADFTIPGWPVENPQSCDIPQQPVAAPMTEAKAKEECSGVSEENQANCVFDVAVTGFADFAKTYLLSERLAPGATKTTTAADKATAKTGENVTFTATVAPTVTRPGGPPSGQVQFVVDGSNADNPVTVDTSGKATWKTSSLAVGAHQVAAKFLPTGGFGERSLASSSPVVSLTVVKVGGGGTPPPPPPPVSSVWWLILLLLVILIIILIVWKARR